MATELVTDRWHGSRNVETEVAKPTAQQIEDAIRALDGGVHTLLTISAPGRGHLSVGGGENALYVVYATRDGDCFFSACRITDSSELVRLNAGGQVGEFPANRCVDLETALSAASDFAETTELDPAIQWKE